MNPIKQYQLELDDSLFKQNTFQILMQSISEVFFSSYLEQFMEIGKDIYIIYRVKNIITALFNKGFITRKYGCNLEVIYRWLQLC